MCSTWKGGKFYRYFSQFRTESGQTIWQLFSAKFSLNSYKLMTLGAKQLTVTCSANTDERIRFMSFVSMFWSRFVTCNSMVVLAPLFVPDAVRLFVGLNNFCGNHRFRGKRIYRKLEVRQLFLFYFFFWRAKSDTSTSSFSASLRCEREVWLCSPVPCNTLLS